MKYDGKELIENPNMLNTKYKMSVRMCKGFHIIDLLCQEESRKDRNKENAWHKDRFLGKFGK